MKRPSSALSELPLEVERYELEPHELYVRPDFTRKTTVVRLIGGGEEGLGEDVTYDGPLQDAQQARGRLRVASRRSG